MNEYTLFLVYSVNFFNICKLFGMFMHFPFLFFLVCVLFIPFKHFLYLFIQVLSILYHFLQDFLIVLSTIFQKQRIFNTFTATSKDFFMFLPLFSRFLYIVLFYILLQKYISILCFLIKMTIDK